MTLENITIFKKKDMKNYTFSNVTHGTHKTRVDTDISFLFFMFVCKIIGFKIYHFKIIIKSLAYKRRKIRKIRTKVRLWFLKFLSINFPKLLQKITYMSYLKMNRNKVLRNG